MTNWSLQPDEPVVADEVVEEATPTTEEEPATSEAPNPMDEFEKRLASLEIANKQAEVISTDLRRSVGRVQSIMDRLESSTGKTRNELEAALDERLSEMTGLLEDVSVNIDDAILPAQVKDKVRNVRAQAAQRAAAVNIDKLVEEKIAAMLPPAPTNEVPADWRAFELTMEKQIKDAGLNPDGGDFDWKYVGALLAQGRRDAAQNYFESTIDTLTNGAKLQSKKESAATSPTGAAGGSSKQWFEKLNDKNLTLDEKRKLLMDNGIIR